MYCNSECTNVWGAQESFRLLIDGKIALAPKLVPCFHMIEGSNARDQMNWVHFYTFHSFLKEVQANVGYVRANLEVRIKQKTPPSYYVRACAQAHPPVLQMIQILLVAVLTSALVSDSKVSF